MREYVENVKESDGLTSSKMNFLMSDVETLWLEASILKRMDVTLGGSFLYSEVDRNLFRSSMVELL